jgi:hypothetical protein
MPVVVNHIFSQEYWPSPKRVPIPTRIVPCSHCLLCFGAFALSVATGAGDNKEAVGGMFTTARPQALAHNVNATVALCVRPHWHPLRSGLCGRMRGIGLSDAFFRIASCGVGLLRKEMQKRPSNLLRNTVCDLSGQHERYLHV